MIIERDGKRYEIIKTSDIVRDGMWLELSLGTDAPKKDMLIFYSDVDGTFSFSADCRDIPLDIVEQFIAMAHELLPPVQQRES